MTEVGFGIIGCGVIAPLHAQSICEVEGARLVAASDVVEANVAKLTNQYGGEVYTDYRAMLARDDIQAVSLCVPSGMRVEIGRACAEAGKHILAEKPLEVSTERIDALIEATDAAGVLLGCIFQNRFREGSRMARRAIEEGRFGKLALGDAYIKWYRSQEYYDSGQWRGTRKLDGGGCLMNQGIHQIDLLLWLMGRATSVIARTALVAHENIEVEDLACAILTFENGAMGVIEGSTATWPGHPARVEIHGSQGSVIIEDGNLRGWQFKEARPEDEAIQAAIKETADEPGAGASDPMSNVTNEGHRIQIEDFVGAIREGRLPAVDGREGRRAVEVIEAVYASAASGKPVAL